MTGLYIHIPFCISKCRYCDFYRLAPGRREEVELFIQCLETELKRLPADFAPESVFLGGGTPTALEPGQLAEVLDCIGRTIDLSQVSEFSSEANPGTLSPEKLSVLRGGGVNRVSIGVQSFNDEALRLLGRAHSSREAMEAFGLLRDAGFENVNLDLIQSIPGMGLEATLEDVRTAVGLEPEHLSCYNLSYEPGTPLADDLEAGRVATPGDDEEADTYFAVKDLLEESGYEHYEISNFCKPGRECRHNLLYWQGGEYLGCGPSAHSHWKGARFGNADNLQDYCNLLLEGKPPFGEKERLLPEEKARETLVMGLRLIRGVDRAAFCRQTGFDVDVLCGEVLAELIAEGLIERFGNQLHLTPNALFVSNSVFSELV